MNPPTFLCHKCGADCATEPDDAPAVCPKCCEDHDYKYEAEFRAHCCQHCGEEAPDDWYWSDDDVALSGMGPTVSPDGPIGTPANSMNGNAMARDKDPAAWDRWVDFCNRCGMP